MRIKIIPCIALACTLSFLVTGCESVTQVFNEIVDTDPSKQTVATGDAGSSVTAEDGKSVDKNLKAPVFNNLSGQSVAVAQDTNVSLDATANSLDGGKITYQWYVNNVGSNGGGTALEKAQNAVYQPDTSEVSVKYYYAVAKNEHESSYTMATSPVYEVKVIKKGEFTTDEFGGVRYLSEDGSYPSDIWVNIGEYTYYFNPDGYRTAGWVDTGAGQYYFDEEGRLVLNFEEAITYYPTASVFVGVVDKSSAESYPAHPDMEAYPEMRTEEGMTGIAITTETPLELKSGEKYTFSVTIMNAFICEFEMTIK